MITDSISLFKYLLCILYTFMYRIGIIAVDKLKILAVLGITEFWNNLIIPRVLLFV